MSPPRCDRPVRGPRTAGTDVGVINIHIILCGTCVCVRGYFEVLGLGRWAMTMRRARQIDLPRDASQQTIPTTTTTTRASESADIYDHAHARNVTRPELFSMCVCVYVFFVCVVFRSVVRAGAGERCNYAAAAACVPASQPVIIVMLRVIRCARRRRRPECATHARARTARDG